MSLAADRAAVTEAQPRTPAPCGTYGGYQRHKRERTTICDECREANRRYHIEYRADPEKKARERRLNRLREQAVWLLVELHRDEFRTIYEGLRIADEVASA